MQQAFKVFATAAEQDELSEYGKVLATYDAFAVVEPRRGAAKKLARRFPCEDITKQYELTLRGRSIRPPSGARTVSARKHAAPSGGAHHYLLQFVGPVKRQWLSRVTRAGALVRELYRDFTYVVRTNARTAEVLRGLPFVRWVGHLPHEDRVALSLRPRDGKTQSLPRTRVRTGVYTVQTFDKKLVGPIASAAQRLGFRILSKSPGARTLVVESRAPLSKRARLVRTLSTVHGVKFIRARALKRTSNDVATTLMGTTRITSSSASALTGKGEIIAICDTGLDTGDAATIHPDFAGRIVAIKSYPIAPEFSPHVFNPAADDGAADLDSGHGTHVAGSVLGDGSESAGLTTRPVRGLAHRAKLVFQAVEQEMWWRPHIPPDERERYLLAGIPTDLTPLFEYAYGKRARIHSNSWGGGDPGDYDEQSEQLDRFVWGHKDFCVVVAAGNDGTDKDGDGKINLKSVTSPGTAKNCITVGACENLRPDFDGEVYGDWWPDDYPVAPFANDPMADDPEQVVAFSSRGPTDDGRIKPEIVAPGTFILSTRSTMIASNNTGWGAFPPSHKYFFMGGTSMATPLAAGAVALVREYLRKKRRIYRPSAALVKATLIAGAKRLPGTAPAGTLVDNHQGYGRVDLDRVLARPTIFWQVSAGLQTGELFTMRLRRGTSAGRIRVVLAYSDFPGSALVNNLNLILTAPDGRKITSAGTVSSGTLALDSRNNVEVVEVNSSANAEWRLDVVASNVPQGPQDLALVILGASRVT